MRKARLIYNPDTPQKRVFSFVEQIVVGRRRGPSTEREGRVRIKDPTISGRHCVVRQSGDGRFYVRDESRNGTRVEGRRLVPNVEVEIQPGDRIQVAKGHGFLLDVDPLESDEEEDDYLDGATRALVNTESEVTILVGDIKGYTTLNQRFPAAEVYPPVGNVFQALEEVVTDFHGTIKEYQGDAIFAFWEKDEADPTWHTRQACHAALALHARVAELADDPEIWTLGERFPLGMDWALTSGKVLITAIGGKSVTGLAMVGDAVNYAFRLEKLANEETGPIIVCQHTHEAAEDTFDFEPLGEHKVAGRKEAEPVYALLGRTVPKDTGLPETAMHEPVEGEDEDEEGAEDIEVGAGEDRPETVVHDVSEFEEMVHELAKASASDESIAE
jgi:class 3 adenylate cyclase